MCAIYFGLCGFEGPRREGILVQRMDNIMLCVANSYQGETPSVLGSWTCRWETDFGWVMDDVWQAVVVVVSIHSVLFYHHVVTTKHNSYKPVEAPRMPTYVSFKLSYRGVRLEPC